jgi:hypothetical protein
MTCKWGLFKIISINRSNYAGTLQSPKGRGSSGSSWRVITMRAEPRGRKITLLLLLLLVLHVFLHDFLM